MSNKKKRIVKKNEWEVNVTNGNIVQTEIIPEYPFSINKNKIVLISPNPVTLDIYELNTGSPVYVQHLPNRCIIPGTDIWGRISIDDPFAEQRHREARTYASALMQSKRISEHPLKINKNLIVLDNLEKGNLMIFKSDAKGAVYVQHFPDGCIIKGATLVGKIKTDLLLEEKEVVVKEIFCEKGYDELKKPMLDQVEHFVEFNDEFEKVRM